MIERPKYLNELISKKWFSKSNNSNNLLIAIPVDFTRFSYQEMSYYIENYAL